MISFKFNIRNPFRCEDFRMIRCWSGPISTNKFWEFQISRYTWDIFELSLDLNWRGLNHAGPWLTINILGWTVDARMYDHRHWDDDKNTWADL